MTVLDKNVKETNQINKSSQSSSENKVKTWLGKFSDLRVASGFFLLNRLAFYLSALIGASTIPEALNEPSRVPVNAPSIIALHWRWDAVLYYTISMHGYEANNPGSALFPMLPFLIRLITTISKRQIPVEKSISNADLSPLVAGIFIVNIATLLAFWLLYKLIKEETNDKAIAKRTVLYAAIFPMAFYYAVPYTEPLFLAFTVGAFLSIRRGNWLQAGLWAAASSATRFVGILLLPSLLLEIGLSFHRGELRSWRDWLRALIGLCLAPLGLISYMIYLWQVTGDPIAFIHSEEAWYHVREFPLVTIWRGIDYIFHPALSTSPNLYTRNALNGIIVVIFLIILGASLRRWPLSYTLYGVLLFLVILASPYQGQWTMDTLGRYAMIFFPVYLTLARWGKSPFIHQTIVVICLPLFGLLAAFYVCWYVI